MFIVQTDHGIYLQTVSMSILCCRLMLVIQVNTAIGTTVVFYFFISSPGLLTGRHIQIHN